MWANERKRILIRNILIGIVALGIVYGLGTVMKQVRQKTAEYDTILSETQVIQQEQLEAARQEVVDDVQEEYEKDLAVVSQYLPGIVCWGDNLTAGSFGNVSYPDVLQKYINAYLCDLYDFRSTVVNAENYTRVSWDDYTFSVPVVNMGSGTETTHTVLGRAGAVNYRTLTEITIPAEQEPVQLTPMGENGYYVYPLTSGDVGVNDVEIAGIMGKLSISTNGNATRYYFTRNESGEETVVPKNTEIILSGASMYKDYIHIVWIGTYGGYNSPEQLVSQVKSLLARQTENTDRYLVLGPTAYNNSWTVNAGYLDNVDSAMVQAFGNNYVNVRKYLCSDGLSDAGINATSSDTRDIQNSAVPHSFRSATGSVELSATAYELIGKLVFERMDRLGFFDEVRAETGLDITMRDILKSDPNYFTKLLG